MSSEQGRFAVSRAAESISVRVGHWTDGEARTGCTAVIFDQPARCAVDVRGGGPGTRETDLLRPGKLVQRADAIVLAGGSAFGLGAADGAMRWLRERGRGVQTPGGPVPIVPAAVIFDLAVGRFAFPTSEEGYVACDAAVPLSSAAWGPVGAGCGATTGKTSAGASAGGIGFASATWAEGAVHAIAVVNALGAVVFDEAAKLDPRLGLLAEPESAVGPGENTTLVVLLVDAPADGDALRQAAVSAHDGMARAIWPCHTPFDGDVVFAAGLRPEEHAAPPTLALCVASEVAVERAIRHAVRPGDAAAGGNEAGV